MKQVQITKGKSKTAKDGSPIPELPARAAVFNVKAMREAAAVKARETDSND